MALKSSGSRVGHADGRLQSSKRGWRGGLISESSTQRGYGYRWQQARKAFLLENPLCVFCQQRGLVTPADVVDHVEPHGGNQDLFWDSDNWQALCAACHNGKKQAMEHGGK